MHVQYTWSEYCPTLKQQHLSTSCRLTVADVNAWPSSRPAIELLKKHNGYCRLAMAYKVRMGERELIQGLRRATIMLMMGQQQQDDEASQGEEVDSDDNDSGSDISDNDYDTNISEASSEEEAAGNAAKRHRH